VDGTCTVAADDVKAVAALLSQAKVLSQWITAMPGFDIAYAAAGRMCGALEQDTLPPCPVSTAEQMAVADRVMADAYTAQGFSDAEAFEVVRLNVAARLEVATRRMFHG
jgi:hypothetical protein